MGGFYKTEESPHVEKSSDVYVCPQCGPDPAGEVEHARTHHTIGGILGEKKEDHYATFESRTCATCAVSFLITPPRIDTRTRQDIKNNAPAPIAQPIRVCRLEPPRNAVDERGIVVGYVQQAVYDANVCWHWRRPGTLPGD